MTGIRELNQSSGMSAAPEHVRVCVVGGRTQLDVALPIDVPIASLLPELAKLVASRDAESHADTPSTDTRHTFWTLSRLDPVARLRPDATLRSARVRKGELLRLTAECPATAPTLYDDVVDAAARLNKAAYPGWDARGARWMSFVGLFLTSTVWAYLLVTAQSGTQRTIIVGLAAAVVTTMVGLAALAHRGYGDAEIANGLGWSTLPTSAAIVWALVHGFEGYGLAVGCAVLVSLTALCYWMIGTGSWGYLAGGLYFAGSGLAIAGHAFGAPAKTVGAALAVISALACLQVAKLTQRLSPIEASPPASLADRDTEMFESPLRSTGPATDAGAIPGSDVMMPTAEAVWSRERAASVTRSALFAGLAANVLSGAVSVLCARADTQWAALVFAGVCAGVLGVYARRANTSLERLALQVPAAALMVVVCVRAQHAAPPMSWTGFAALLVIGVVASVCGLRLGDKALRHRLKTTLAYLEYSMFAALIPLALWVIGGYADLDLR